MNDTKATAVWMILVGISLLMFAFSQIGFDSQLFVVTILISTWFKGQMIIDHFMDLRYVEIIWRLIISIWLILVLSVILIIYLLGSQI